jgi:hypothetical protein
VFGCLVWVGHTGFVDAMPSSLYKGSAWAGTGRNKRTSPRRCWGDVRVARVIGLPGVRSAPR